ncbi:MAG TPA: trehalose-6-phosphate synthase [Planctomycetaceae bacterium]|jgi:trehalose 6-phosphate synthase
MPWSKERLEAVASERLNGARLIVVANREPYIHVQQEGKICCLRPASGLTTALDPVMRACGGVWVAHGSGDADRSVVDDRDRVLVPPETEEYALRRIWLSRQEEQGFYYGFSNETIWPLCHVVYTRPKFNCEDWDVYRRVNQKFADAVLDEASDGPAVVFVQDYHFALLPRMLKNARSDLVIAHFWHIPWPNREAFRICPWQQELLDGLLGNDLLSFQIQHHCNNFLDTVERGLEAMVDPEHFSVTLGGHVTRVRPHAISIDPNLAREYLPADVSAANRQLRLRLGLGDQALLVGVDRVDYTKGIPERFRAFDRLLAVHPEWIGNVTFVQVGAPSRVHIANYRHLTEELMALVDEINWRHGRGGWKPIVFLNEHQSPQEIFTLCRIAAACVVSSLHDGMNLVAKEFIAARDDERGVLVLSRFTGAARELDQALLVNPYAVDSFAEVLQAALMMPADEQERRMRRMRQQIDDNNVYRWAGSLLSNIGSLVGSDKFAGDTA